MSRPAALPGFAQRIPGTDRSIARGLCRRKTAFVIRRSVHPEGRDPGLLATIRRSVTGPAASDSRASSPPTYRDRRRPQMDEESRAVRYKLAGFAGLARDRRMFWGSYI